MRDLSIDYEVYSACDLKKAKIVRYSRHPTTDLISLAWKVDDQPTSVWVPHRHPAPARLIEALKTCTVHAFNAPFEWYITREVGWMYGLPEIDYKRMRCSAGQALHANMAADLDTSCAMLNLPQKDAEGHKAMLRVMRPAKPTKKKPGGRIWDRDLLSKVYEYNRRDVEVEHRLHHRLPPLPSDEQEVWELDRRINMRGIPIDVDFCNGALSIIEQATERVQGTLEELMDRTEGNVERGTQVARILEYVQKRGVNIDNLRAETVSAVLETDIPEDARIVLELRQMVASAAVKKFSSAAATHWEGRAYETQRYHKAHTGRWAGDGLNPFNFKKGVALDEQLIERISSGDVGQLLDNYKQSPIDLLGKSVRGIVCAKPGHVLVRRDYAQIECRLAYWLCGRAGEAELDLFRRKDEAERNGGGRPEDDPYIAMAAEIHGVSIAEAVKYRHDGKITKLGAGFGMGEKRFAEQNGVSRFFAKQCIDAYRTSNPFIVDIWYQLGKAALTTVAKGVPTRVGKLRFALEGDWLTMRLPSGRKLYYFSPGIGVDKKGRPYVYYTKPYGRERMWGGVWLENACQAICRDLLVPAMMEMDARGISVILNVYDEVMAEASEDEADDVAHEMGEIIDNPPDWAAGLPIFSDIEIGRRFEKVG